MSAASQLTRCLVVASLLLVASPSGAGQPEEIDRSVAAVRAGSYRLAAEELTEYLARDPGNREARLWLARALSFSGDHAGGEREYRRVLATLPDDAEARLGLADVLAWQKQYSEAQTILVRLAQERPDDPEVWTRRGRIALWSGHRAEAKGYFEKALALYPQGEEALRGYEAANAPLATSLHETEFGFAGLRMRRGGPGSQVWAGVRDHSIPGWEFLGRVDFLRRFGEEEGRGTIGSTRTWRSGESLRVEGALAPDAEIFSRASVETEVAWPLSLAVTGYIGGKFARYASADVWNAAAAAESALPGANALFVRYVFSRTEFNTGGTSDDGTFLVKVLHYFTDDDQAWLYYAHGTEGYATGTVDQVGEVAADTMGLGARAFPWPRWGIEGNLDWQEREGGNRYVTFTGVVRFRF
jgi:YaiO family outer membrane protein